MSRLEELGGLDAMYGSPAPRVPDLDEISTSDSGGEEDAQEGEDDMSVSKLASSPPPGSPEPAPEVRCMWEDCGETFTSLHPFIEHLHNCTWEALMQFISVSTSRGTPASGTDVRAKARARRRALRF